MTGHQRQIAREGQADELVDEGGAWRIAAIGPATAQAAPLAGQNQDLEPEYAEVAVLLRVKPTDGRPRRLFAHGAPVDLIYKRVLITELIERCGMNGPVVQAVRAKFDDAGWLDVTKPLRVDANEGRKTKEEALGKIKWLESQGVELIEQPLPAGDGVKEVLALAVVESGKDGRAGLLVSTPSWPVLLAPARWPVRR